MSARTMTLSKTGVRICGSTEGSFQKGSRPSSRLFPDSRTAALFHISTYKVTSVLIHFSASFAAYEPIPSYFQPSYFTMWSLSPLLAV